MQSFLRALGLSLLVLACHPSPADIAIHTILVSTPVHEDGAFRDTLRSEAQTYIRQHAQHTHITSRERDATHTLDIRLILEEQDIALGLTLLPVNSHGVTFQATASIYGDPTDPDVRAKAFLTAWAMIQHERTLIFAPPKTLIQEATQGQHTDIRYFAIQALGRRKLRDAIPALTQIITIDEDPYATLRAVGALVEMQDQNAVQPIINLTKNKEPDYIIQLLFALARIGGPEAESFLLLMASGHPDERVNTAAQEALRGIQKP